MAYSWTYNQTPATGAVAVYALIALLVSVGWTKVADSDGTTYSSSGTQVTGGGSGTNGLANANAWVRLRAPNGVRELTFQRGSANALWRIKYSASERFSAGSPGATQTPQTPTSTEQQILLGGGTDASPTFSAWFATDGTYRAQYGADAAAPFAFWFATYPSGGGTPNGGMVLDPVLVPASADQDQAVIAIATSGGGFTATTFGTVSSATTGTRIAGWLKYNVAGAGFVAIPANKITSSGGSDLAPEASGSNPHSGSDDLYPVIYGRPTGQSAPQGYKGISSVMYWNGTVRATGDTLAVSTTRDRLVLGQVNLPWNGQIPLV